MACEGKRSIYEKNHFFRRKIGKLVKWTNVVSYHFPPLLIPDAYLIGTPIHDNIGDSAIVLASLKFLRECYPQSGRIKEMTWRDYIYIGGSVHRPSCANSRIFGHAGGNMGDLWFYEEQYRRNLLTKTIAQRPVILPQTIYYSDSEQGRREQDNSVPFYNTPRVTIVARERISFDRMRQLYPQANVLLTPDIVLSTTAKDYGVKPQPRSGILWVMRSDKEKAMTDEARDAVLNLTAATGKHVRKTDMHADQTVFKHNRKKTVRKKMQEFAASELVITDRLHGMIFAAITETPCIVFSNNHHKVRGTYEWLRHLPYIRFAETTADAERYIPELLEMKNCRFDNTPLLPYFETLKQELRKETK